LARTLPPSVRAALLAQESGEAIFVLLTITHSTLSVPIRCTSDAVDTVSRGNTYQRFPFDVTLADEDGERPPRAQLNITNVDRRIVQALRAMADPPTVTIEVVAASDLDAVIVGPEEFKLEDAQADAAQVTGTLVYDDWLNAPYPGDAMTPSLTPGVHG
jgi:hypothetical protein